MVKEGQNTESVQKAMTVVETNQRLLLTTCSLLQAGLVEYHCTHGIMAPEFEGVYTD